MEDVILSLEETRDLAYRALRANGCDDQNAAAIAGNMSRAQRDGSKSHGLYRLPGHIVSLKNGKVNGASRPSLEKLTSVVLRVNGDRGFAPVSHEIGLGPLAEAALEHGIAALSITRTHHFAALWPETEVLAEHGLSAIAVTSAPSYVAPAGGTKPFFGTNPMSFAWPRVGKPPMAFDQASSAMARGEVAIALRDKHDVPDGVGLDANGAPTNDPGEILKGAQLPFGGYKGSAIALMVDLLAGPLIGEVTSHEALAQDNRDGGAATGGQFILAMNPARFGAEDAIAHGERLFEKMLGIDGVRLPGDRRIAARAASDQTGVRILKSVHDEAVALAGG